VLKCSNINERK